MRLTNYHTHTIFCDGKNTAEEMVLSAIDKGMAEIGFSVHSPLPFPEVWDIKKEKLPEYISTLKALREKYKDKIKIYIGIEQDYYSEGSTEEFDYVLGSVHYIYKNGKYLPLDLSAEATKENIDKYYNGDAIAYCEDYYKLVADVYNRTRCQIIGHFDLITKFNERLPLIDTNNPRYVNAVNSALKSLLDTPAIFEINTGAISRGYRTSAYPEDWILHKIAKRGKPFVVNSDSHNVDTIDFNIEKSQKELDSYGYKYIESLDEIL
ncbi:MAG: histidinol-phosphatase [Clostridia bacterium]|nr:histidinol-phosphatase [Clostridia bacterium]